MVGHGWMLFQPGLGVLSIAIGCCRDVEHEVFVEKHGSRLKLDRSGLDIAAAILACKVGEALSVASSTPPLSGDLVRGTVYGRDPLGFHNLDFQSQSLTNIFRR